MLIAHFSGNYFEANRMELELLFGFYSYFLIEQLNVSNQNRCNYMVSLNKWQHIDLFTSKYKTIRVDLRRLKQYSLKIGFKSACYLLPSGTSWGKLFNIFKVYFVLQPTDSKIEPGFTSVSTVKMATFQWK